MSKKALVGNAADKEQVKSAARKEKYNREQELNDLREVLGLPSGRRLITKYITKFRLAGVKWLPGAEIHRLVGHHECANVIMRDITEADPNLAAQMMIEAYINEMGITVEDGKA